MRRDLLVCSLLATMAFASASAAGPYDLIVADGANVTLCGGCGITLAGLDYGLLVNTGTTDITIADLRGARFSVSASQPEIVLIPFINIPNEQLVGAIHPGEAMGSIITGNELLLALLRPDETLRNLPGMQFMAYQIERPGGSGYVGPVDFDVHMTMAGYQARFIIHAQVAFGSHAISFTHATRVSAAPGSDPDCGQTVAANPVLWPPNHRMVPVDIAGVADALGRPTTITATAITQDEPPDHRDAEIDSTQNGFGSLSASVGEGPELIPGGDGGLAPELPSCPDARIVNGKAYVRAERSPQGNGRVYTIAFTAMDSEGFACSGAVNVCVPRLSGDSTCVDDGQVFNSLDGCRPRWEAQSMPANFRLTAPAIARGVVVLSYSLEQTTDLDLDLFDVAGRRIATIEKGVRSAGDHTVSWSPGGAPRGVYFVRGRAGRQVVTRQVVLTSN